MSEFEQTIAALQQELELSKKLERLESNPDFRELILEGYLKQEPERITELMGSFAGNGMVWGMITPGQNDRMEYTESLRKHCIKAIEGVSSFHTYLKVIHARGDRAEAEIEAHREAQAEEIAKQGDDQ